MLNILLTAARATFLIALMTGIIFPLAMTFITQTIFPDESKGSLVKDKSGQVIGSRLIGQSFTLPKYFHPRPSAAGSGYAGEASAGTNLGPTSSKLILGLKDDPTTEKTDESFDGIKQLCTKYRQENKLAADVKIPVDAVSRSGSGLDPDISYQNAVLQMRRVAEARNLSLEHVKQLLDKNLLPRQFGLFGEPRVNVLLVNLALDNLEH